MKTIFRGFCTWQTVALVVGVLLVYSANAKPEDDEVVVLKRNISDHQQFSQPCNLSAVEQYTQSAYERAKTDQCRQMIVDVACSTQRGEMYDTKPIQRSCPSIKDLPMGKHMGCYFDRVGDRDMGNAIRHYSPTNDPQSCIYFCLQEGYRFAAVQYGVECFCGHAFGRHGRAPDFLCRVPCGNQSHSANDSKQKQYCGGSGVQDVYSTGLVRPAPYTPPYVLPNKANMKSPVRIMYLLTVSGRNYRQVLRLIRRIYHRDNYYLIHVDLRATLLYDKLSILPSRFSNVRFTTFRLEPVWGGTSLLNVMLLAMRDLVNGVLSHWSWTYMLNLSESDYPIKTDAELKAFLSQAEPYTFVHSHSDPAQGFIEGAMTKSYVECDQFVFRVASRHELLGLRITGGADWYVFHSWLVHYLADQLFSQVSSTDPDAIFVQKVYRYFNYTLMAPESFFHHILSNSHFCSRTVFNNNLRHVSWRTPRVCSCTEKPIDGCGCSPSMMRGQEMPRMLDMFATQPTFFARKFDSLIDGLPLLHLDSVINAKNEHFDRLLSLGDANDQANLSAFDLSELHSGKFLLPQLDTFWYSAFDFVGPIVYDSTFEVVGNADEVAAGEVSAKTFRIAALRDAHTTMSLALMHQAVVSIQQHLAKCSVVPEKALEITLYRSGFEISTLVKFNATVSNCPNLAKKGNIKMDLPSTFEAMFSLGGSTVQKHMPRTKTQTTETVLGCLERLQRIDAGYGFDELEIILRGTPGVISLFTDLKIIHRWTPALNSKEPECRIRFILMDPTESAQHTDVYVVQPIMHAAVYAPKLPKPHLPGFWTLLIVPDEKPYNVLASFRFLIAPHAVFNDQPLADADEEATGLRRKLLTNLNYGRPLWPTTINETLADIDIMLAENANNKEMMRSEAARHGKIRGKELLSWVKMLYARTYELRDVCVLAKNDIQKLQTCPQTRWSSLSPDQTMHIGHVNKTTGRLI